MGLTDFEPTKIQKVKINNVRPNTWNPKEKNHEKVQDIKRSIQLLGFKEPIQVRENDGLEIIDGEQQWTAMKELGADYIYVYNNGVVSDKDAQNETLWWQIQVPFETIELAQLVTQLDNLGAEMPYSKAEIAEFKQMAEFDFSQYNQERPEDEEQGFKTLMIKMTEEQYEVIQNGIQKVKQDNECSDARALELIIADYLAGA